MSHATTATIVLNCFTPDYLRLLAVYHRLSPRLPRCNISINEHHHYMNLFILDISQLLVQSISHILRVDICWYRQPNNDHSGTCNQLSANFQPPSGLRSRWATGSLPRTRADTKAAICRSRGGAAISAKSHGNFFGIQYPKPLEISKNWIEYD